ncbi:hypothetical protein PYCC9005_005606 [Savitreella phatthalungensis]
MSAQQRSVKDYFNPRPSASSTPTPHQSSVASGPRDDVSSSEDELVALDALVKRPGTNRGTLTPRRPGSSRRAAADRATASMRRARLDVEDAVAREAAQASRYSGKYDMAALLEAKQARQVAKQRIIKLSRSPPSTPSKPTLPDLHTVPHTVRAIVADHRSSRHARGPAQVCVLGSPGEWVSLVGDGEMVGRIPDELARDVGDLGLLSRCDLLTFFVERDAPYNGVLLPEDVGLHLLSRAEHALDPLELHRLPSLITTLIHHNCTTLTFHQINTLLTAAGIRPPTPQPQHPHEPEHYVDRVQQAVPRLRCALAIAVGGLRFGCFQVDDALAIGVVCGWMMMDRYVCLEVGGLVEDVLCGCVGRVYACGRRDELIHRLAALTTTSSTHAALVAALPTTTPQLLDLVQSLATLHLIHRVPNTPADQHTLDALAAEIERWEVGVGTMFDELGGRCGLMSSALARVGGSGGETRKKVQKIAAAAHTLAGRITDPRAAYLDRSAAKVALHRLGDRLTYTLDAPAAGFVGGGRTTAADGFDGWLASASAPTASQTEQVEKAQKRPARRGGLVSRARSPSPGGSPNNFTTL